MTFDSRSQWDGGGFTDPRVMHFWDQQDILGNWFVAHMPNYQGSDWDTYLLFDSTATWTTSPPKLVSSGATVIDSRDALAHSISPLLGAEASRHF